MSTKPVVACSISVTQWDVILCFSGWKWEKGGVGMGGKDAGVATELKETVGKAKEYKVPEFFKYNQYSYFDVEKDMEKQRVPQVCSLCFF